MIYIMCNNIKLPQNSYFSCLFRLYSYLYYNNLFCYFCKITGKDAFCPHNGVVIYSNKGSGNCTILAMWYQGRCPFLLFEVAFIWTKGKLTWVLKDRFEYIGPLTCYIRKEKNKQSKKLSLLVSSSSAHSQRGSCRRNEVF